MKRTREVKRSNLKREVSTLETKYGELVWYEDHRDDDDSEEHVERIESTYPAETAKLHSEYSITTHGFNCAMLATTRLLLGLMSRKVDERREARENFPDFNTNE